MVEKKEKQTDVEKEVAVEMKAETPTTGCRDYATVAIICLIAIVWCMDHYSLGSLIIRIQCDFKISDTEGGLLQSAFVVGYFLYAPFMGYLADRYNRKYLLAAGMLVYSGATLASTFMTDFGWFVALRTLEGIGEASYNGLGPTIISDLFQKSQRTRMLTLFFLSSFVSSGLGFIMASGVTQLTDDWRWGIRVTPIMGLVSVILILLIVRDPPRGHSEVVQLQSTPWKEDIRFLSKNTSFVLLTASNLTIAFTTGSLGSWGPKLIQLGLATNGEFNGQVLDGVSGMFGLCVILSGIVGIITGSLLALKLRSSISNVDPIISGVGMLISVPILFTALCVSNGPTVPTYLCIFFGMTLLCVPITLVGDMVLYIVTPNRRSTARAIQILMVHLLGDAGSPFIVGLISESIKGSLDTGSKAKNRLHQPTTRSKWTGGFLSNLRDTQSCTTSPIDPTTVDRDFHSLQYALFLFVFIELLGAFLFLSTSWIIDRDKQKAIEASQGNPKAETEK